MLIRVMILIKKATNKDCLVLAELAVKMWNNHSVEELEKIFIDCVNNENAECFIKCSDDIAIGFAQCGLRFDYVEGTNSSPVGYLEGVFVEEDFRHKGYAKELLNACENWAKDKGCSEFASDCELDNRTSLKFHLSMGFDEANRIICFRKEL